MKTTNNRSVVVIVGPGRSGTSLAMQILHALGMNVSEKMVPPKEHNPEGAYEDLEIYGIQDQLLKAITPDNIPPYNGWMENAAVSPAIRNLKAIIESRIENGSNIWGFKDPRTALFIPMWTRIFNSANIIPKYILTVRNPAHVVSSQRRQFNIDEKVSELTWLTKNTEALYHTGANCFIVHYEDWFDKRKAVEIADNLIEFTGLKHHPESMDVDDAVNSIIKPRLNRAVYDEYEVVNRNVHTLYRQLSQCRGFDFDRIDLMATVKECRQQMNEFSGWASEARNFMRQAQNLKKQTGKKLQQKLEKDLEESVIESNRHLKGCKDLQDKLDDLRIQASVQDKEYSKLKKENRATAADNKRVTKDNKRLTKDNFALRTSTSFRIGQILVLAFSKPGKNTLLLPFRLVRIIFGAKAVGK